MKINRGREAGKQSKPRSDVFTGEVWMDFVLEGEGLMINDVFFTPGARTDWHKHELGQILYVKAGEGRIYDRDGNGGTIGPGDVVHIPAGEEHWHGAGPETFMLHMAISLGGVDWLDKVTDADYTR